MGADDSDKLNPNSAGCTCFLLCDKALSRLGAQGHLAQEDVQKVLRCYQQKDLWDVF